MNCERTQQAFSELYRWLAVRAMRRRVASPTWTRARVAVRHGASSVPRSKPCARPAPARTTPQLRKSILTAIDAAAEVDAQASEDAFERATVLAAARFGRHERRRFALVSCASAIGGLAAGFVLFFGSGASVPAVDVRNDTPGAGPEVPMVASVEVPAPVSVQPSDSMPETIVRYVAVPRFVERVVVVAEIVEVERGPLVAIDFAPLERVGVALLAGLESWRSDSSVWMSDARRRVAAWAESGSELGVRSSLPVSRTPAPRPTERVVRERTALASSVSIRRFEGDVRLETRGPLADVVPLLVAQLDDEDPRVRGLVARRLESIRDELAADPVLGSRLREVAEHVEVERSVFERWFGDEPDPKRDPSDRWSEWRSVNRELLVAAGPARARALREL